MTRVGIPNTELRVSRIALGAGAWGASLSGSALDRLLEDYLEAGGNFLDTAHCYAFWTDAGAGSSERELGAAVRRLGVRGEVVIATKGGHPDGGASYPRPDAYMAPDVLRQDLHESLERLGVDHVDLYYLYRDDPRAPVAEALDCLNQEIAAGRVRHIGASNWSLARLAEANEYAARAGLQGFVVSQMQWSLATPGWSITEDPTMRCIRSEDVAWHVETGAPVVAYTATAGGSFAASAHPEGSWDTPENRRRHDRALRLSVELGRSPTQIALAYLMHQPCTVIPLIGTTNRSHLAEALGACKVRLTPEQVAWLRG